ncbi:MAG TPA: ATP-dependent endonuclease [Acidimicrobiaceae bacterium]|nr:ATP-dependent endonuclease [Acidimicrobiaceae bacterium]
MEVADCEKPVARYFMTLEEGLRPGNSEVTLQMGIVAGRVRSDGAHIPSKESRMRLKSLRIQNFRSCRDVQVDFDSYTCLVGANGAGKSTVLAALNVLFRHAAGTPTPVVALAEEDFTLRDTSRPVEITATFADLTSDEREDFKAYFRQDRLIIKAVAHWDEGSRRADVKQFGARLVMREFAPWFRSKEAGEKVSDLKVIYADLRKVHVGLAAAATRDAMEEALRSFEEANAALCSLVDSEDQFYGWSKGENRLRKYLQWVFVPAVKEAVSEQSEAKNTALGELLQRTIRATVDFDGPLETLKAATEVEYAKIVTAQQSALRDVSLALEARLKRWAHPDARLNIEWQADPEKAVALTGPSARASIGEGGFVGEVSRLGHGLQRSFIVALLQELSTGEPKAAPALLLGFEEPELYQHPPQARHLASTLQELAEGNAQVIVATHSPFFASGRHFESVRVLRKSAILVDETTCTQVSMRKVADSLADALGTRPEEPSALLAAIEQILQPSQRELLFCGLPVLVEGEEDVALIAAQLRLSDRWDEFRRLGGHFVLALGKTNLSRPLAICNELEIPAYVVFDGDGPHADDDEKSRENKRRNERDNKCLMRLAELPEADPLSEQVVRSFRLTMWPTTLSRTVQEDMGLELWRKSSERVRDALGLHGVSGKNGLLLAAVYEDAWNNGARSPALAQVCEDILARGSSKLAAPVSPS